MKGWRALCIATFVFLRPFDACAGEPTIVVKQFVTDEVRTYEVTSATAPPKRGPMLKSKDVKLPQIVHATTATHYQLETLTGARVWVAKWSVLDAPESSVDKIKLPEKCEQHSTPASKPCPP